MTETPAGGQEAPLRGSAEESRAPAGSPLFTRHCSLIGWRRRKAAFDWWVSLSIRVNGGADPSGPGPARMGEQSAPPAGCGASLCP